MTIELNPRAKRPEATQEPKAEAAADGTTKLMLESLDEVQVLGPLVALRAGMKYVTVDNRITSPMKPFVPGYFQAVVPLSPTTKVTFLVYWRVDNRLYAGHHALGGLTHPDGFVNSLRNLKGIYRGLLTLEAAWAAYEAGQPIELHHLHDWIACPVGLNKTSLEVIYNSYKQKMRYSL